MAVMIPSCGPAETESFGERQAYHLLRDQLSDEFTVIHSLPWLCSAVALFSNGKPPTGEIDFLIIHPQLGVIALEVKSGAYKSPGLVFVHVKTGRIVPVVAQTRNNAHGLARWLGESPALRIRIGYGVIFPDSDFTGQEVGAALLDRSVSPPAKLYVGRTQMPSLGAEVVRMMTYWSHALSNPPLGTEKTALLVNSLCPGFDGTPDWSARVWFDNKMWLRLTEEQATVVNSATRSNRLVLTGWPGTGKTVIAIELARRMMAEGLSVLILTFNKLLMQHLRDQFHPKYHSAISTWHSFAMSAARSIGKDEFEEAWMDKGCIDDVRLAEQAGRLKSYDVLLIDEAQAFKPEWCEWLARWHDKKKLIAFCDETQIFSFEKERVSLETLCAIIKVDQPFSLSISIRSPRAVFDRLTTVLPPSLQMSSPREHEADAISERLCIDMPQALAETLQYLREQGLDAADVVILSKWEIEPPEGMRSETISRFRGLEAPAVVIWGAQQMDDAELFCAYSRATTLCIALYDAEVMGCVDQIDKFHTSLLQIPEHAATASEARISAQPRSILMASLNCEWFETKSARIGWCHDWNAWLIEGVGWPNASGFWVDYFSLYHPWPIFDWSADSIRKMDATGKRADIFDEDFRRGSRTPLLCDLCKKHTPHYVDFKAQEHLHRCDFCDGHFPRIDAIPDENLISKVIRYDKIISSYEPKAFSKEEIAALPLSLAAYAAWSFSFVGGNGHIGYGEDPGGNRLIYRAALAFGISRINWLEQGKSINVAVEARKIFDRYVVHPSLSYEKWHHSYANAMSTLMGRKLLRKISRGVYALPD